MSMTVQELSDHVMQELPKGIGIFISLAPPAHCNVSVMDSRNYQIHETVFHVESDRDLEATVLDALSHAQAEVWG